MTELLRGLQQRAAPGQGGRFIYIGHQANLTMLHSVAKRCEIPEERHFHNIALFGNQAAAGAPAVLSQRWDEFRAGDVCGLVVVGSGLSWASSQVDFV
jgi:3-oxoacyl-[acyl-carrier-protein] synthase-3